MANVEPLCVEVGQSACQHPNHIRTAAYFSMGFGEPCVRVATNRSIRTRCSSPLTPHPDPSLTQPAVSSGKPTGSYLSTTQEGLFVYSNSSRRSLLLYLGLYCRNSALGQIARNSYRHVWVPPLLSTTVSNGQTLTDFVIEFESEIHLIRSDHHTVQPQD